MTPSIHCYLAQIPNVLTISRLIFIPAVAWFFFSAADHPDKSYASAALALTALAASTDWIDGFLARRFSWVSNFGKLADPLVDKALVLGLFAVLLLGGALPAWGWLVVVVTFLRDALVTVLRTMAARRGQFLAAASAGKWKTAIQLGALLILFAVPALRMDFGFSEESSSGFAVVEGLQLCGLLLFALSGLLAVSSGMAYAKAYAPLLRPVHHED